MQPKKAEHYAKTCTEIQAEFGGLYDQTWLFVFVRRTTIDNIVPLENEKRDFYVWSYSLNRLSSSK